MAFGRALPARGHKLLLVESSDMTVGFVGRKRDLIAESGLIGGSGLLSENGRTARVLLDGKGAPATHIVAAPKGGGTLAIGPASAVGTKGFGFVAIDGVITEMHVAVLSSP